MPIMLRSGRRVTRTHGVPTLEDIAYGLARIPRFVGQTVIPWTVLDHVLYCASLVATPEIKLAMLLHDAHEALTSDIPTDMKTDDMRTLQGQLDVRIMDAYYPGGIDAFDRVYVVPHLDRLALAVEAAGLGVLAGQPEARAATFGFASDDDLDQFQLFTYTRRKPGDYLRQVTRLRKKFGIDTSVANS